MKKIKAIGMTTIPIQTVRSANRTRRSFKATSQSFRMAAPLNVHPTVERPQAEDKQHCADQHEKDDIRQNVRLAAGELAKAFRTPTHNGNARKSVEAGDILHLKERAAENTHRHCNNATDDLPLFRRSAY